MMRCAFGVLSGGLLIFAAAGATEASTESSGYICTLTGKQVELCCCTPWADGRLYCTLAKKAVDSCCCKAAQKKPERRRRARRNCGPVSIAPTSAAKRHPVTCAHACTQAL